MNKDELIKAVALDTDQTKVQVAKTLESTFGKIKQAVSAGEEVFISGFGKFTRTFHPTRNGFDPIKQEPLVIPGKHAPKFSPALSFKSKVKEEGEQSQ